LAVLDLTNTQTETFVLWGIRTLADLAALPEKQLIARMRQDGKRVRQLARGEHPHLFQPVEPPFTLDERMDAPFDLLNSLLFIVNMMVDQPILKVSRGGAACSTWTAKIVYLGANRWQRTQT
jgi:protein ImuB